MIFETMDRSLEPKQWEETHVTQNDEAKENQGPLISKQTVALWEFQKVKENGKALQNLSSSPKRCEHTEQEDKTIEV